MRLKTFRARTMGDALAAVKKELGKGAVILHTRSVKTGGFLGFGAKPLVEIIASDDVNVAGPTVRASRAPRPITPKQPAHPKPAPDRTPATRSSPTAALPLASAAAAYSRTRSPAADPPATSTAAGSPVSSGGVPAPTAVLPVRKRAPQWEEPPKPSGRTVAGRSGPADSPSAPAMVPSPTSGTLEAELAAIKQLVGRVLVQSGPTRTHGAMPDALFKQYIKLLEGQVGREIADEIIGAVRDELTVPELSDEQIVRESVLRHVAGLIPVAGDDSKLPLRTDGHPLVIALVGPTGVGKTTTLAKLAATYKLRYGKKVGLITTDTYRIAGVDQVRTYAGIIAVPLRVVLTPAEMRAACAALADCDVILIDTAGRSPNDSARLAELRAFIDAANPHETHLVLSSASCEEVLKRSAQQFSVLRPNRLILTKLDETVNFGVLINALRHVNTKLSFVTTGQEVPDQIEPGQPERLARLVLDGGLTP